MTLTVKPITPRFGAEITGVDITQPLDDATRQAILDAQHTWGVTFWPDTGLDDASHVAFSRNFGYLERVPRGNRKMRWAFSRATAGAG